MSGFDLIVIGLGAAGSATLYQAARRGAHVLGLDRHRPPHDQGSSHGETRIIRQAIGEGLDYVPLALRAYELWREIESESGEALLRTHGALMIGAPNLGAVHHGKHDFLERTLEAAEAFAVEHEVLDAAEVRARYPRFRVADHERAYFEPGAGALYPERCIAAQLALAGRHGAAIRADETVTAVESIPGAVRVTTTRGVYEAGRAIVCAGAWTADLLGGGWTHALSLYRQSQHWYEPDAAEAFAPGRFPVFIWMYGAGEGDWFYGFPHETGFGGVKIASEQFAARTPSPGALDREVTRAEALAAHKRHVVGRIDGLPPRWLRSTACVYTGAPESRFIIAPDPAREGVTVVSACSGHGFKHSAAIGEAVAEWVLEGRQPPILKPFGVQH